MSYQYLPLSLIKKFEPMAKKLGVSKVARGRSGFLSAYKRSKGNPDKLSDAWDRKREGFIKRHMAKVKKDKEPLWENGLPTRRHLALIMWAYSPNVQRLFKSRTSV